MIRKGCVRKYNLYSGDCDLLIFHKIDVKRKLINTNNELEYSKGSYCIYDNIILCKPKNKFIIIAVERLWSGFEKMRSKKIQKRFTRQFLGVYFNGNSNPKKNNKIFKIMNEDSSILV